MCGVSNGGEEGKWEVKEEDGGGGVAECYEGRGSVHASAKTEPET